MTGIFISDMVWSVEDEMKDGLDRTSEWFLFLKFLDEYFCVEQTKDRVLTGGRYGCAQYSMIYFNKILD